MTDTHMPPLMPLRIKLNKSVTRLPLGPAWERQDQWTRLGTAYRVVHGRGGKVFTLRLDLDTLIRVTGSLQPARTMSRLVQRALKRAGLGAPSFGFALEVTRDNRNELHLHGAIDMGTMRPLAVKNALREAAGRIGGRPGSRQVHLANFDISRGGPLGWALYPTKAEVRTRDVIKHHKLTYISDSLRRDARRCSLEERRQAYPVIWC